MPSKGSRKRKGSLEETLSYATYSANPSDFEVTYRDLDTLRTVSLGEFMKAEDYAEIPASRILTITHKRKVVWRKGQKQVSVKEVSQEG